MSQKELRYNSFYKNWSFAMAAFQSCMLILSSIQYDLFQLWILGTGLFFVAKLHFLIRHFASLPLLIGYANWVTSLRLLLILVLSLSHQHLANSTLFLGFLLPTSLDGLDGYLARKFGHASSQGENMDMETDAFLVFILSFLLYTKGIADWWVLIPGGMRYFYRITISMFFDGEKHLLKKKGRSTIAVVFFISLLSGFVFPKGISFYLLTLATVLILFSFFSPLYLPLREFFKVRLSGQ